MSFTNLSLGHNWPADEWPEYVEVDHDDGRGGGPVRYVPERMCRNVATEPSVLLECSECGACFVQEPIDGCFGYCPNCGARVVEP